MVLEVAFLVLETAYLVLEAALVLGTTYLVVVYFGLFSEPEQIRLNPRILLSKTRWKCLKTR